MEVGEKNTKSSLILGKETVFPKKYCPDILFTVERKENRKKYDITGKEFCGFDSWHVYESTFLKENGIPITGILKIVYDASSPRIIESKSLKLYTGSFGMERLGDSDAEAISNYKKLVAEDISRRIESEVKIGFFTYPLMRERKEFSDYIVMETIPEIASAPFTHYKESPFLLEEEMENTATSRRMKLCTHLLKSNCKITAQPDYGSVYIDFCGFLCPSPLSLLRYIVSLREENHFHEEICEMIFKRIYDCFKPEHLNVSCLYTRRGGIDICPSRSTAPMLLPRFLGNPHCLTPRNFRR